jgi:hypothetical protein
MLIVAYWCFAFGFSVDSGCKKRFFIVLIPV